MFEKWQKQGLKFKDMTAENLIDKIGELERHKHEQRKQMRKVDPVSASKLDYNRPKVIWKHMSKKLGDDFFLEAIEEAYGIKPGSNEFLAKQISDHFENQI